MEIQCDKCGNQNPLGALFCRTCGAKLDMEKLRPQGGKAGAGGGIKRPLIHPYAIRRLISLVVFLCLLGLCGLFLLRPGDFTEVPGLPLSKDYRNTLNRLNIENPDIAQNPEMMSELAGIRIVKLKVSDIAAMLSKEMQDYAEKDGGLDTIKDRVVPHQVSLKVISGGRVRINVQSRLNIAGMKLSLYSGADILISGDTDPVTASMTDFTHGKLPAFGPIASPVQERISAILAVSDKPQEWLKQIKSIEIDGDDLTIKFIVVKGVVPSVTKTTVRDVSTPKVAAAVAPKVAAAGSLASKLLPKLVSRDGKSVDAQTIGQPKYIAYYFSASWCGPCVAFSPKLIAAYESLKQGGVQVILAGCDADKTSMLAYMNSAGHIQPWPGLCKQDHGQFGFAAYGVSGIPAIVIVDANGKVVANGHAEDGLLKARSLAGK
jgi:thiol-disulfide isomerase/thioredoxin/ribosomal protein L40E